MRRATARLAGSPTSDHNIEVPLEQGENQIRIVVRNKIGQTVRGFVLFRDLPGPLDKGGTLYVLAIGVGLPAWLAVSLVTLASAGVTFAVADRPRDDAART